MGRPKKLGEGHAVHIVLPVQLVADLDEWVANVKREVPGGSGITRADLIRDVLQKAVEQRRTPEATERRPKAAAGARH